MNIVTGIDAVEISRFLHWHKYPIKSLKRIFTDNEIDYCLSNIVKSSERFASRFAAKEALFKALSHLSAKPITFLTFCASIELQKINGIPSFKIDLNKIKLDKQPKQISVSLTHTDTTAIASVIVCF